MTYTAKVHKVLSKSGNRVLFFGEINGKRISKTNWARKWEAVNQLNAVLKMDDKEKLNKFLAA
jgi:hypothetical protein